ncbi:hypothetical protein R3P38DRAFT_2967957 [Favolaschia claudopus]|uniref:BTB domain-containing protein n=1 Tax=Favolaschia claudopus TaxID=2862362 RepID=A0AAW0B2X4_9AGAR
MAQYSRLFNPPDADVIFQSSDGVLFGIHRINLCSPVCKTNKTHISHHLVTYLTAGEIYFVHF